MPDARGLRSPFVVRNATAVASPTLRVVLIVAGLFMGVLVISLMSDDGFDVIPPVWDSTFGSLLGISQVVMYAGPLLLAGVAVAIGQTVGLWNIGVDGQLYFGAWAAAGMGYLLDGLTGFLLVPLMILASIVAGAAWISIAAFARSFLKVNEIITTLMLNFVALSWLTYWARGPWSGEGTQGAGSVTAKELPSQATLPQLTFGDLTIGLGFIIAIVVALAIWVALRYTRLGYRVGLIGADQTTAAYAGIHVPRTQAMTLLASGAIGGLIGSVVMLDQTHALTTDLSSNTGFLGVVVVALAGTSLLACIPMAIILAWIAAAGLSLQISGISPSIVLFLTGLLLLVAAVADVFARLGLRRHLPRTRRYDAAAPPSAEVSR